VKDGEVYFITICTKPRGQNQLCTPETARWIKASFDFVEKRGDWWVRLLLLMPDHLHALMSFPRDPGIRGSILQWKRYAARQKGIHWQRDFSDHRLRSDESEVEKASYIRRNPGRKGLVGSADDWPFVWSKGW
jgi:putative transposase